MIVTPKTLVRVVFLVLLVDGLLLGWVRAATEVPTIVTRELVVLEPGSNGTLRVGVVTTRWRDDPLNPVVECFVYGCVHGEVVCVDIIPGEFIRGGLTERPDRIEWGGGD